MWDENLKKIESIIKFKFYFFVKNNSHKKWDKKVMKKSNEWWKFYNISIKLL
jgi:hypothetical protein